MNLTTTSLKKNGEKNLTNEQKANEFLQKVDDWIEDRNVDLAKANEEVDGIMALTVSELRSLDQQKALSFSFVLFSTSLITELLTSLGKE